MAGWASILADVILVAHFAFIVFVIGGQILVIIGHFLRWRWVRNLIFRIIHLAAITYVTAQAWLGKSCPLTVWEQNLRRSAGEATYSGSFIGHWVGQVVFYDAPPWVFVLTYSLFGTLVCASWIWIRPRWHTPSRR